MARNTINEMRDALQQRREVRTTSKGKCASCGKPTTNYRCEACWAKLRGEGDQGEGRKRNPLTNKGFKPEPWKPLTALPVAFVPDRQAEFFARQEAKQKEAAMNTTPEAQRTYTMKELAALAGVPVRDIYDAKKNQHKALLSAHSGRGKVVACMQEHGITWEQVQGRTAVTRSTTTAAPHVAAPGADGGVSAHLLVENVELPINKNNVEDIARRLDALFSGVSLETAAKAAAASLTRMGIMQTIGEVVVIRTLPLCHLVNIPLA